MLKRSSHMIIIIIIIIKTLFRSEAIHRRAGFSVADRSVQTEQSDIIDVQEGMNVLEHLMQEANELRQDLNFVEVTLKANYEKQIQEHSEEL